MVTFPARFSPRKTTDMTLHRNPLAALAATAAIVLLLSGCSARDTASSSSTIDSSQLVTSLPAAKKDVDNVTWAIAEGEPNSLDPLTASSVVITPNLCDNLLRVNDDFSVSEGLATKAEWVNDTTFVIDLRKDATFWDGTPVSADDVVYSLTRNLDPTSQWYSSFALIDNITATSSSQVTITFTTPDSTFRNAIASAAGAVVEKAYAEKKGKDFGTSTGGIMCSGPYEFSSWTPGSKIVTTANPNYWDGAPHVKTLTYVFITDSTTLTNALLDGEVDGAFNVTPSARASFESSATGRLIVGPSTASIAFGPLRSTGAGANTKIRQALSLAIDREQFTSTVLNGLGTVQKTFTPPFAWNGLAAADIYQAAYDALPTPTVDIEKAKTLVAESGYDTSTPLVLATPAGNTEMSQAAAIIQSAAKSIGLTVTIDSMQAADYGALFYDTSATAGLDLIVTTSYLETPGVLSYAQWFTLDPATGGYYNYTNYDDADVRADISTARTTFDETASAEAFVRAQSIFADQQLQITLGGMYQTTYLRNGLTGVTTSVALTSSPWALHLGAE